MRAPEVFLGEPCTEPLQVWAVAAMLLFWIKPGILGAWDSPHPLINEAWCMAKIKRLFPHRDIPTPDEIDRHTLKAAIQSARRFNKEVPDLQAISSFDVEIRKVEVLQPFGDLLRLMFVADPVERPSASSVLASSSFRSFYTTFTDHDQQHVSQERKHYSVHGEDTNGSKVKGGHVTDDASNM